MGRQARLVNNTLTLTGEGIVIKGEEVVKLAIVGSTKFDNPQAWDKARDLILKAIKNLQPEVIISGGAVGIDSLAASIARELGIPLTEHLPKNPRWKPEGFQERNALIANECTHLLRIVRKNSSTYGSGWTHDQAKKLGKDTLSFEL